MEAYLGGKYMITGQIKSESMLLAVNAKDNRKAAIKQYSNNAGRNFCKEEIKKLFEIDHKNILVPLEMIEEHKCVYVVYDYCSCENLEDYVRFKGSLEEDEVKEIVKQMVEGYAELATHKVLHKNIKPRNILLDQENGLTIRICDFGIMKKDKYEKEFYAAPEIANGATKFSVASDIWSIGAVAHFMANGKPPRSDPGVNGYFARGASPLCKDFVSLCLQREAGKRATLKELAAHPFVRGKEEVKHEKVICEEVKGNLTEEVKVRFAASECLL